MRTKKCVNNQNQSPRRSFIEQARRRQIIEATIDVLAEHGYVNCSFSRIAKQAEISPSLISYHFKDKEELTSEVRNSIYSDRLQNVKESIAKAESWGEKLRISIESDMYYMGNRPKLFRALIEVLFSERDSTGKPKHMTDTDPPMLILLRDILISGQKDGEFGSFDPYNLALLIDGAKDQFLAQLPTRPSFDLKAFTETLAAFAMQAVRKN